MSHMLLRFIFLPVKPVALLFVVATAFVSLSNVPAQALLGDECEPGDAYCTPDGHFGWPANREPPNNPDKPNPTGKDASANPNPPTNTSSAPSSPVPVGTAGSDYPDGTYKNHALDPGAPNDGHIPNGAPDGRGARASKPLPPAAFRAAKLVHEKDGQAAENAIRPAGPCYRPNTVLGDGYKKDTVFYLGVNWADPSTLTTPLQDAVLRAAIEKAASRINQYFGTEPNTSGQATFKTQWPSQESPNFKIIVKNSLAEAEDAAKIDSLGEAVPINIYNTGGKFIKASTKIGENNEWERTEFNLGYWDYIRKEVVNWPWLSAEDREKRVAAIVFVKWIFTAMHEFAGHGMLQLEDIGEVFSNKEVPFDDDGSIIAYQGTTRKVFERAISLAKYGINVQIPNAPAVSACDALYGWVSRPKSN